MVNISFTKEEIYALNRCLIEVRTRFVSNQHSDALLLDKIRAKLLEYRGELK